MSGFFPGSPVWQSAYIVIAHTTWRAYGDVALLRRQYAGLRASIDYFNAHVDPKSGVLEQGRSWHRQQVVRYCSCV